MEPSVAAKQGIVRKPCLYEKELFAAIREGMVSDVDVAVAALKRNNGNLDTHNIVGSTALHIAVWRNHVPIVKRLLAAGADIDVRDGESGWSSLHRALHFGHLAVAGVLIEAGANLTLEDSKGRTPVDLISNPIKQIIGVPQNAGGSEVFSWGNGSNYQLGTGTVGIQKLPCRLDLLQGLNVISTAAAKFHSLAVTADGNLYSWGFGRGGRLGHTEFDIHSGQVAVITPRLVSCGLGARQVKVVAAAKHHTVAATNGGEVFTWGSNREGQLGYTSVDTQPIPRRVTSLKVRVVAVAAANKHSAVLTDAGEVFTWGCNREGQLGYGTSNSASNPIPRVVEYLKGKHFSAVSVAKYHTVVLGLEGEVFTWGYKMVMPRRVLMGRHTKKSGSAPLKFHQSERLHIVMIAAGARHSTALSDDGHIFYWVSADPYLRCHQLLSMASHQAISVAAGKYRTAVVTAFGVVYAWDGEKSKVDLSPAPFRIHGIRHVTHVSVAENHSLAVASIHIPKFLHDNVVVPSPSVAAIAKGLEGFEDDIDFEEISGDSSFNGRCQEVTEKQPCDPPSLKDLCQKVIVQCMVEPKNSLQLLEVADSLGAQELRRHCEDLVLYNLGYLLTICPTNFGHILPTLLAELEKDLDAYSSQPWSCRLLPTPTAVFPAVVESEEENGMGQSSRLRLLSFSGINDTTSSEGLFHQESEIDIVTVKHLRALRKKLQQIEALELKRAKGYMLDHQQEAKVQTKKAILDAILAMDCRASMRSKLEQKKDQLPLEPSVEKLQNWNDGPRKIQNSKKKSKALGEHPTFDVKKAKNRRPVRVENSEGNALCGGYAMNTAPQQLPPDSEKEVKLHEDGFDASKQYNQICGFDFGWKQKDGAQVSDETASQSEYHGSLVIPSKDGVPRSSKKGNKKGGLSMFLSGALDDAPKPPAVTPIVPKSEGPAWGGAQKSKDPASFRKIQCEQTAEANSCASVEDPLLRSGKTTKLRLTSGDSSLKKGMKFRSEIMDVTDIVNLDSTTCCVPLGQLVRSSAPIAVTPTNSPMPTLSVASQHEGSPTPWAGTSPHTPSSFKDIQMEQVKRKVQQAHGRTSATFKSSRNSDATSSSVVGSSLVERGVESEKVANRWYKPEVQTPSSLRCIQIEETAINELQRMYKNAKVVRSDNR